MYVSWRSLPKGYKIHLLSDVSEVAWLNYASEGTAVNLHDYPLHTKCGTKVPTFFSVDSSLPTRSTEDQLCKVCKKVKLVRDAIDVELCPTLRQSEFRRKEQMDVDFAQLLVQG